jgi:hypothetical protein
MIGEQEYARTVTPLQTAGQPSPVLYTAALDDTASLNTIAFDFVPKADVQVVVIFAPPTRQTIGFVKACLTNNRTADAVLLGPSLLTSVFFSFARVHKAEQRRHCQM